MKSLAVLALTGCILTTACSTNMRAAAPRVATGSSGVVCTGPVKISSQADVRSVGSTCVRVDGDLVIAGTNLTNLDGLENVHSVRHLVIVDNPALKNIEGVRGLATARGIAVMKNPALRSLRGLEGLTRLDGAVITDNGLTSLDALRGLSYVGDLVIAHNPNLTVADGIRETANVADVEDNGAHATQTSSARVATQSNHESQD